MILTLALAVGSVLLWQDPGVIEAVDFTRVHPEPAPPYTFLREDPHGTSPKIYVRDANEVEWRVKGGRDAMPEAFVTRFVSALGYYAETTVFSAKGRIEGIRNPLERAQGFIQPDGTYTWASFEKVEKGAKFVGSWSWEDPSLKEQRELRALKVLMMLFSNWDNKDQRDERNGSNTSILEFADGRKVYFVNDWGQTLGSWARLFGRINWSCEAYSKQTPRFVRHAQNGFVRFGYVGGHTIGFRDDVRTKDVKWLMQYLGRITDAQIRMGLKVAGASPAQEECFTRELRARIEQLRRITLQ